MFVQFSDQEWERLQQAAAIADAQSAEARNTRPWNKNFNLVGIAGEAAYSRLAGVEFYPERRSKRFKDNGEDFPGVDVKATVYEPPLLLRLRTDPLKADYFALFCVYLEAHNARYVGYATREELDAAPDYEYGHGPTRTLTQTQLRKGLPPHDPQP